LRDSPAIAIIERLMKLGARVQAFDPTVNVVRSGIPNDLVIVASSVEATAQADVLAVLTEWDEFKWVSPSTIAAEMTGKQVVDARNLLDRKDWERAGFTYQGIGR
jgi:UDPglucose 6-dehydrogenase